MDAHDHMPVQTETVSSYYDQQGNIVKKVTTTVENYEVGTKKIHLDNSDKTLDNGPNKPNEPNEPNEPNKNKPNKNKPNKPNKPPSKHKKTKAPMRAVDVSTTMVPSWSSASHDDAAPFVSSSTTLVLPSSSNTPGTFPFAPVFFLGHSRRFPSPLSRRRHHPTRWSPARPRRKGSGASEAQGVPRNGTPADCATTRTPRRRTQAQGALGDHHW